MGRNRDTRETTILAAAVTAIPLLLGAGIGVIPQLHGLWWRVGVIIVMLVVGVVIAVRIVRSARNLLEGAPGDDEVVRYKDDRQTGILLKGSIENVSLRVSTVHQIVDALTAAIPPDRQQTALYGCGREVGEDWVEDFHAALPKLEIDKKDIAGQILKWSEYDATAGMGRLTVAVNPDDGVGLAVLSNGFLSREPADYPLNWWFAGYLAGSLTGLLNCPVKADMINPTSEAKAAALFAILPESAPSLVSSASLRAPSPQSVARGKVWLRRLKTPVPGEWQ